MNIQKMKATIIGFTDLSESAREIQLQLPSPFPFMPGAFVNVFFMLNNERVRRAYSISSDNADETHITLSIRKTPGGLAGQFFWKEDIIGTEVEIQGPLGLNTADKMHHTKVFLFGFGIGVSVIKALTHYLIHNKTVRTIHIMTGSRDENDVMYKEFFQDVVQKNPHITYTYIVSRPSPDTPTNRTGYIQDHIENLQFDASDVYVCGQEKACNDLIAKIKTTNPTDCSFFVEAFH